MEGKIAEFLEMQSLLAHEKGWDKDRTPEGAPFSILWSIDELGEAIAIIKKKGGNEIMNNAAVRAHFIEEVADTFMYLFDMMNAYGITSDEFTAAYAEKFSRNLGRNWSENNIMYEKNNAKLIIFDMEGTLVHESEVLGWTERLVEILSHTDIKLDIVTDLDEKKAASMLEAGNVDSGSFHKIIKSLHYSEAYETAMKDCGVQPEETVVCSSSSVALKLAQRKGIKTVAVRSRLSEEIYKKVGVNYITTDLLTLPEWLEK